jgi:ABC-type phosphate transport system permease subunit
MHLFTPINFLMPFLAHALGTLLGAYIAALIAASHKMIFGITIGACFLVGGIMNIMMLPSPLWFSVVDVVFAYIPMGYLGAKWAIGSTYK